MSADHLDRDTEIAGIVRALDGRFVRPAPGGDLLRMPEVLPTGRNLHGFDPFRIPSAFALQDGARQAARLLERYLSDDNPFPETVAMVLWGTDNLKTEGAPIAQALALIGAAPRFDSYGRLAGATLIPLDQLARPRVDVVISLSGIFRDLLPLQIKLLAEAAFLAASADEPVERNFVRKHALAYGGEWRRHRSRFSAGVRQRRGGLRPNVNNLIDERRLGERGRTRRNVFPTQGFRLGRAGQPAQRLQLLDSVLAGVDSPIRISTRVELGVTTVDNYFDTLGGVSRAVKRAREASVAPVYIGDQTEGRRVCGRSPNRSRSRRAPAC